VFQKYDAEGQLIYERRIQGPEIDPVVACTADDLATAEDR
jgi:hypothetical protein